MSKLRKTTRKQRSFLARTRNRVLVVAAHPDDEMLGLYGSLIKHKIKGDLVDYLILSKGRNDPVDQNFDQFGQLYWNQQVEKYMGQQPEQPTIVYTHWDKDRNKDHRIASEAVTTALRPWLFKGTILFFETPDGSAGFDPNYFVEFDYFTKELKLATIERSYKNELRPYPHPRSLEGMETMMRYRGSQCGYPYAEGFKIYRSVNALA